MRKMIERKTLSYSKNDYRNAMKMSRMGKNWKAFIINNNNNSNNNNKYDAIKLSLYFINQ